MSRTTRVLPLAVLALLLLIAVIVPGGHGAPDIDRSAVDWKTPAEIKWVRNAAGTNESAVLFGDPSKPGPYVVRLKWLPGNMSRPHFHPNDRFFVVLSGTWWMGTGETVRPGGHGARAGGQLRRPLRQQGALRRRQGRGNHHPGLGHGPRDLDSRGETLMAIAIRQVGPCFAGEVDGIDLATPLSPEDAAAIHAGMDRYAVLVFHGRPVTLEQQMAFTLALGPIEQAIDTGLREANGYRIPTTFADVSNLDKNDRVFERDNRTRLFALGNRLWHSDSSFKPTPAKYSLLHAHSIPSRGGNTEFADMRAG